MHFTIHIVVHRQRSKGRIAAPLVVSYLVGSVLRIPRDVPWLMFYDTGIHCGGSFLFYSKYSTIDPSNSTIPRRNQKRRKKSSHVDMKQRQLQKAKKRRARETTVLQNEWAALLFRFFFCSFSHSPASRIREGSALISSPYLHVWILHLHIFFLCSLPLSH